MEWCLNHGWILTSGEISLNICSQLHFLLIPIYRWPSTVDFNPTCGQLDGHWYNFNWSCWSQSGSIQWDYFSNREKNCPHKNFQEFLNGASDISRIEHSSHVVVLQKSNFSQKLFNSQEMESFPDSCFVWLDSEEINRATWNSL